MSHTGWMLFGIAIILASGLYVVAGAAAGMTYPSESLFTWVMWLGLAVSLYGLFADDGGRDDPGGERNHAVVGFEPPPEGEE